MRPKTGLRPFLTVILSLVWLLSAGAPSLAQEDAGAAGEVFEIDAVNEGLPPVDGLDRSTPRATLEGFVDSADGGDFALASQFLNLDGLDPAEQAASGSALAMQLRAVLARKVWLDWGGLPDRPDGLDAFASADAAEAGVARRSLRLAIVDAGSRPVELRLNRYQAGEDDPVWLISDRTVGYVPVLYAEHGPASLERLLPDMLRQEALWSMPIWQLIAMPLILALAAFVGFAAHRAVEWAGARLRKPMAEKSGLRWLPQIVDHAATPVGMFFAASLVAICNAQFLTFSGPANSVASAAITITLVIAGSLVILRVIGTILDMVTSNFVASIDDEENSDSRELFTNISVARRIVILVAFLVGAAVVVFQLNLSQTLGVSLLASAGVLSLILGFAAQAVLGNILASIQIAIAKPIRIGDSVLYEGEWGYVEEINYTYVLIRTWDMRRLIVPVLYFVSEPFENWSMRNTAIVKPIEVKLDPTADVARLREAFDAMVRADEDWDGEEEPQAVVTGHDDRAITVRFTASAKNPSAGWDLECRLREQIFAFLRDEEGGRWLVRERQQMLDPQGRATTIDAAALA